ncbi:MAG TPA: KR domain-containing protein, partial [Streptosporangiaceae bacterium]
LTAAGSRADRSAALREVLADTEFADPARRLISAVTGREVTPGTDIRRLLCDQITEPVRLAEALRAVADGVDLLLDTGPGEAMAGLAADAGLVPVVSLAAGPESPAAPAVAAALFAAGAVTSLSPLLAGRPARPIDIRRPRVFITNPCAEVISAASAPADTPPRTTARETSAHSPAGPDAAADPYPGVGPWLRCFTEQLRPSSQPEQAADEEPWRLHATTRQPFGRMAAEVFEDDPAATGVLAVIGDLADPDASSTLIGAARAAATAGSLVVITPTAGLAGFCASLHAEQPSLGITLIRTTDSMDGLLAAQRFAVTEPGRFRELVLDASGAPHEPVMVAAVAPDPFLGPRPDSTAASQPPGRPAGSGLGRPDVVLVSGGPPGDLLAMAQLLAGSGARLALVGGPVRPAEAAAVDLALQGLRRTGTMVSYLTADISDPDQAEAVVARIERQAGPVTAVCYPASSGLRSGCTELPADQVRALISAQGDGLSNLLGAIGAAGLRLLVTIGALPARYGAARHGAASLCAAALAEQARRLGQGLPGGRVLHADVPWPPGSGPASPAELGRLLTNALAHGPAATRIAIHGRPGRGTGAVTGDTPGGRFLQTVRVHCPHVELVAEAQVSTRTDPYLADYLLDGRPVLPPAIGLEAMAQAAAALAGRPLRDVADVSMEAPVVLPLGDRETTLRVCALLREDSVETVLRAAGTGFSLDHFRAFFRLRPGADSPGPAGRPGGHSAADGHDAAGRRGQRLGLGAAVPGSIVDGTDVYGPICFQRGPFRRVAFLTEVTARSCRGLVRGADDRPWFTPAPPGPGQPAGAAAPRPDSTLILGSPGLNDAVMHMLQASVPDRRMLPAGFRSLTLTGQEVCGAVQVGAERAAGPTGTWQVSATDATGRPVLTLSGLRLREAGSLPPGTPWHPTLLAAAIEGRGAELGLDPALRVSLRCGLPPGPDAPPPPTGLPWVDTSAGTGSLAGFQLTAQASMPVACHWETTEPRATEKKQDALTVPEDLARQLRERYAGQPAAVSARLRAIVRCLAAAGWPNGAAPELDAARDSNWARIRAGKITVACTVAVLDGVPQPVAIALATWPTDGEPAPGSPAASGQGATGGTSTSQAGPSGRPAGTEGRPGRPGDSLGRRSVLS